MAGCASETLGLHSWVFGGVLSKRDLGPSGSGRAMLVQDPGAAIGEPLRDCLGSLDLFSRSLVLLSDEEVCP